MRLINIDGRYGCIASWVRPEISNGGRKIVPHNEFTGDEKEVDRDDAHILFRMTGDVDPVKDINSSQFFNTLFEEKYVENTEARMNVKMTLALMSHHDIEGASESYDVPVNDESIDDEEIEISEAAIDRAFRIYDEEWRTYSKSLHPLLWTILLLILGAGTISFGLVSGIRVLIFEGTYDYLVTTEGWGYIFTVLSCAAAFFADGFLRDQCNGFVARRFGARVIYKGFVNGSWFHGDWYLIDDSVVCGKYGNIRKLHIRLAGSYCDFLVLIILASLLPLAGNGILYAIVIGALLGIVTRCALHLYPMIIFDDWEQIVSAMLDSEGIITDVLYFFHLLRNRNTRRKLFKEMGIQVIGMVLVSVLLCIGVVVGYIVFIGMLGFLFGWIWGDLI